MGKVRPVTPLLCGGGQETRLTKSNLMAYTVRLQEGSFYISIYSVALQCKWGTQVK